MELAILIIAAAWVLAPVVRQAGASRPWAILGGGALLVLTGSGAYYLQREGIERGRSAKELIAEIPREQHPEFVTSKTCRACHPDYHASWHRTYHRTMTQAARPESVVGDFSGIELTLDGRHYTVERVRNEFWVTMPDPEWLARGGPGEAPAQVRRRVVMTTGSHHMQVYWLPTPHGNRLYSFPFCYLFEERRWVPNESTFLKPPGTGVVEVWNESCIRCHAVAGQPKANLAKFGNDSAVAELGISCEACHGPAAEHIRWHRDPANRYRQHLTRGPDATMINPRDLGHRESSQICGQCHSVSQFRDNEDWLTGDGAPYRAGENLNESQMVIRHPRNAADPEIKEAVAAYLRQSPGALDGSFWRDGMIRVSGREYNGLIESGCYQHGELSCISCHSMHDSDADDQLTRGLSGDESCLQCHTEYREDLAAHTFHPAESSGSRCLNCHMPHTTYGLLKAIRAHEIDSPSVPIAKLSGRPTACNLCHLDRPLGWVQDHLTQRYGAVPIDLTADEEEIAASVLWVLKGDAGLRALAAWHMGWAPAQEASGRGWMPPFLSVVLNDNYPAARFVAQRSLRTFPEFDEVPYDYLETPPDGTRGIESRWEEIKSTLLDRSGARLLLDAGGDLMEPVVTRLRGERDERIVELRE